MGINLTIQNFKETLAKDIKESHLPPGVLLMVLNEFTGQIQLINTQAIANERALEAEKEGADKCNTTE